MSVFFSFCKFVFFFCRYVQHRLSENQFLFFLLQHWYCMLLNVQGILSEPLHEKYFIKTQQYNQNGNIAENVLLLINAVNEFDSS